MKKLKVAVLISGSGTNLQALIDSCTSSDFPAEIVTVISNKKEAYGLVRANKAGIKTYTIDHRNFSSRKEFEIALNETLEESGVELICLAGFMRLLTKFFVEKWQIINIHPSLLPSFKGADAHKYVIDSGVKISGCTVHFVIPKMDSGPIIIQNSVPVYHNDTPETLGKRVLKVEHQCYPEALKLIAEKRISIKDNKVIIKGISS